MLTRRSINSVLCCILCAALLAGCQSAGTGLAQSRKRNENNSSATVIIEEDSVPLAGGPGEESPSLGEGSELPSDDTSVESDKLGENAEIFSVGDKEQVADATEEELLSVIERTLDYYRSGSFPESEGASRFPALPNGTVVPDSVSMDEIEIKENYFFYAYAAVVDIGEGKEMLMGIEYSSEAEAWEVGAIMFRDKA